MDFQGVRRQLEALGYRAVNIQEMATHRGVAATWRVMFGAELVACCSDAGDGSCLSVLWRSDEHRPVFRTAGEKLCSVEPEELALVALSLA